jgi:hypothetical protein
MFPARKASSAIAAGPPLFALRSSSSSGIARHISAVLMPLRLIAPYLLRCILIAAARVNSGGAGFGRVRGVIISATFVLLL